jgi:hypothetical protein
MFKVLVWLIKQIYGAMVIELLLTTYQSRMSNVNCNKWTHYYLIVNYRPMRETRFYLEEKVMLRCREQDKIIFIIYLTLLFSSHHSHSYNVFVDNILSLYFTLLLYHIHNNYRWPLNSSRYYGTNSGWSHK